MKSLRQGRAARLGSLLALVLFTSTGDGRQVRDDPAEPAPTRSEPITLTLRAAKERYCRIEPIVVECELVNHSKDREYHYRRIWGPYFDPRSPDFFLYLGVANRDKEVPLTRHGSGIRVGSSGSGVLPPGDRITWRFCTNAFYDMTVDGEYVITASMPVVGRKSSPEDKRDAILVESEPIRITVAGDCPAVVIEGPTDEGLKRPSS